MKAFSIVIIVMVVSAVLWKFSGEDTGTDLSVGRAPAAGAVSVDEVEGSDDATTSDAAHDPSDGTKLEKNAKVSVETSVEQSDNTDQGASPFSLVDDTAAETLPSDNAATERQEPDAVSGTDQAATANDGSSPSLDPVVVPSSYPVTDAAKYFIPKDERGPGRLGGPPPLDFPGGPSDPNRQQGTAISPPIAPGQ